MSKNTVIKMVAVDVTLTPKDLATNFWLMDCDEQALFFNSLSEIGGFLLHLQLASVSASSVLESSGRSVMEMIGDYSEQP
jgi:hypothetical protein